MNRFVTVLLLLSSFTIVARAQNISLPTARMAAEPTLQQIPFVSPIAKPVYTKNATPQAAEVALSYFLDDGNFTFFWPFGDTVTQQDQTFIRYLNLERFTTDLAKPILDSVHFTLGIVQNDATLNSQNTNNHLVLFIMGQEQQMFPDGVTYPVPGIVMRQQNIPLSVARYGDGSVMDTTIKFGSKGFTINVNDSLGQENIGSFFVGISSYFPGNQLVLLADSNLEEERDLDPELDRSFWIAINTDGSGSGLQGFWAKRYVSSQDQNAIFYPNFVMTAYLHDGAAAVDDKAVNGLSLEQNYPNSFSGNTEIRYSLNEAKPVRLAVYNSLGSEVATLVNRVESQGHYSVTFDGSNLPSGTYFYTLTSGSNVVTRSMKIAR